MYCGNFTGVQLHEHKISKYTAFVQPEPCLFIWWGGSVTRALRYLCAHTTRYPYQDVCGSDLSAYFKLLARELYESVFNVILALIAKLMHFLGLGLVVKNIFSRVLPYAEYYMWYFSVGNRTIFHNLINYLFVNWKYFAPSIFLLLKILIFTALNAFVVTPEPYFTFLFLIILLNIHHVPKFILYIYILEFRYNLNMKIVFNPGVFCNYPS